MTDPADVLESRRSRISDRVRLGALLALFVVLAVLLARARPPQADEGHFANAGWIFATEGRLAFPMWSAWIPSLDHVMFITMPIYYMALGIWFKIFGLGFVTMRLMSVACGLVLVASWYRIGSRIGADSRAGILVATFVGLNYDVVNLATARYDIMAAALGAIALAVYLTLREQHLARAILISHAFSAAACFTHPFGLFPSIGVVIFALWLDARRIRVIHVVAAAIPFVVALGLWGLYIAQTPDMFREQFSTNASGRLARENPFQAIRAEVRDRYLGYLGGWQAGAPAAAKAKILLLFAYVAGLVGCLAVPSLRRSRAVRALLVYVAAISILLPIFDKNRWYVYLVHFVPALAACVGLTVHAVLQQGQWKQLAARAAILGYGAFAIASVLYRANINVQGEAFEPAVRFLQAHVREGDLVISGGEFGVGLGFQKHVLDDAKLGYHVRQVPDFVVMTKAFELEQAAQTDPLVKAHVAETLRSYPLVFESTAGGHTYRIYKRPTVAP